MVNQVIDFKREFYSLCTPHTIESERTGPVKRMQDDIHVSCEREPSKMTDGSSSHGSSNKSNAEG